MMTGRDEVSPNVILIMTDQQKATSLGLYGNPDVRTPALERLASQGVRFEWAFTPHPLCVPARTSVWTGAYPHNHGVRTNELNLSHDTPSYLRSFQDAGYRTGLIGKNHCFDPQTCGQLDVFIEYMHRGIVGDATDSRDEKFRDWITQPGLFTQLTDTSRTPLPADYCPPVRIAKRASEFISSADGRPFLLWVSFPEPHEPYYAPEPFYSEYDPDEVSLPPTRPDELADKPARQRLFRDLAGLADQPEHRLRGAVAAYYASISFVDAQVQRILEAVAAAGVEQETIVVYVSDHGDFAGEHGLVVKCNAFYDCLTRVPLLISWPGRLPAAEVVDELVSTIDIMPTVAALAGVPALETSRGRILPGVGMPAEPRDAVFAEYGAGSLQIGAVAVSNDPQALAAQRTRLRRAREADGRAKMVRTREWKYVFDPMGDAEELYNLRDDPWELENLANRPDRQAIVQELRTRLLRWSIATEDSAPVPLYFDLTSLDPTEEPRLSSFDE